MEVKALYKFNWSIMNNVSHVWKLYILFGIKYSCEQILLNWMDCVVLMILSQMLSYCLTSFLFSIVVRALTSQNQPKCSDCVKATKIGTHMYFDILFHIRIGGILGNAFEPSFWGSKSPTFQFFQHYQKRWSREYLHP